MVMKNQENLQRELINRSDALEETLIRLNKANIILNNWLQEYAFPANPDLGAALSYWNSKPGERSQAENSSVKWLCGYNQIYGFIDIAHDYIYESKKALEAALEKRGG